VRFREFITGLKQWGRAGQVFPRYPAALVQLALAAMVCVTPWSAKAQEASSIVAEPQGKPDAEVTAAPSEATQSDATQSGAIRGTIVDKTGTLLGGVRIKLTREGQSTTQEVTSG